MITPTRIMFKAHKHRLLKSRRLPRRGDSIGMTLRIGRHYALSLFQTLCGCPFVALEQHPQRQARDEINQHRF